MNTDRQNQNSDDRDGSISMARTIPAPFGNIHVPFFPSSAEDVAQGTAVDISWFTQGDASGMQGEGANFPACFTSEYESRMFLDHARECSLWPESVYALPGTVSKPAEHVKRTAQISKILFGDDGRDNFPDLHIVVLLRVTCAHDIPVE